MSKPRLTLALQEGGLRLPDSGRIGIFGARAEADLSGLPRARVQVVQRLKPDFDALAAQGFDCVPEPEGRYAAALVYLPRAKAEARAMIAAAAAHSDGLLVIDGQKTDGIESILKEMRRRAPVAGQMAKAHGKIFWLDAAPDLSGWAAPAAPALVDGRWHTAPGVFSADGVDPASRLLADNLPAKLGARVADLGAGWGYLSASVLETHPEIATLHLVEADRLALDCARANTADPRAVFHWADATVWQPDAALDTVVMNPPFHTGRAGDPGLGRAFIVNAARILKPSGQLWMVANRHLPYEATLTEMFGTFDEVAGDARFKVLHAQRPTRKRRGKRLT